MQHVILFYYLTCLILGISSTISLSVMTLKTRNPFFAHYLVFNVFYSLLITTLFSSLYQEMNFPAFFESYRAPSRLAVFLIKSGLACALTAFVNFIFDIPGKKWINLAIFLLVLCAVVFRLGSYFDIIPEGDGNMLYTIPLSRIPVDGVIILCLLSLFVLRLFRLKSIVPEEFKRLVRLVNFIIAVFSPALILEVVFYDHFSLVFFSPAMYCIISLVFAVKLTLYYIDNYRLRGNGAQRLMAKDDPAFASFVRKFCLSRREEEILVCLLEGSTNNKIASDLFISASTVKAHIYNIFKKTAVKTRHQLVFKLINQK